MDITGFIIDGNHAIDDNIMKLFNKISPIGNFHNKFTGDEKITMFKGTPYFNLCNGVYSGEDMYSFVSTQMKGYNFAAFRTISKSPTEIKKYTEDFKALAATKDPNRKYEFVNPYTFFDLVKQSGQGLIVK